jgi:cleavage and polyadenylation specificity factor subunit 3
MVHCHGRAILGRFTDEVGKIVRRGGRCLLPVFALGRAQELMLILDEYWHANKDLQKVGRSGRGVGESMLGGAGFC